MHYFIADMHFCHRNILSFQPNRSALFPSIDHMNRSIIHNWNQVVTNADTVTIVGDVGIGSIEEIVDCVGQLKGKLRLVPGNHDSNKLLSALYEIGVEILPDMYHYRAHGVTIYVSHFPLEIGVRKKYFNIHGHIHENPSRLPNQLNVGVDVDWGLPFGTPIAESMLFDEILRRKAMDWGVEFGRYVNGES